MRRDELFKLMLSTVRKGTEKAFEEYNVLPDFITRAHAYRLCGRNNIDRWISEGLIHFEEQSIRKFIDRKQLEAVMANSNRITYLPVAER